MANFTPVSAAIGGVLIGLSAVLLMLSTGRIAGISGILGRALDERDGSATFRVPFLLGLIGFGLVVTLVRPEAIGAPVSRTTTLVIAGLLVGFGTTLGNGCTSGHGVCGLSRLSRRSFVATLTFMAVAAITVFVARHVIGSGGAP